MNHETQVAIIGCGPVGATLANLLGRRGISVCLIEKQPEPFGLPRAIHFDGEVMRIFQAAGLAEQILPSTMVGRGMLFKDKQDTVLIDWSREQKIGPMGWYESYRFHQPGLEEALLAGLDRFEAVKLIRGRSVVDIEQSSRGVDILLDNGQKVSALFAVGCDGAASDTREILHLDMEDLGYNERWLVIDLVLKVPREDLGDYSIQFCDPDNPATYVRGVGDRRRWEMRLKPDDPEDVSDGFVWDRLKRWIRPDEAYLERKAVYTFRSSIAQKWQAGRCFIAGDAAHQMPPFMGQGMCAGIRDVANLAWKLDLVLKGADEKLLETYGGERQQNVRQFIELTVRLGKLINQTEAGKAPSGNMKSIWPSLGEGFGVRDGIGGELTPQVRNSSGQLADDVAKHGFYVLAQNSIPNADKLNIPVFEGAWDRLDDHGFDAALIRPDGYAVAGIKSSDDVHAHLAAFGVNKTVPDIL